MIKSLKLFLTAFALVGFLAGCASNGDSEQGGEDSSTTTTTDNTTTTDTGGSDDQNIDTTDVDVDPLENVDSVFYFEFDQSILNSAARAALTVHAEVIKNTSNAVRIEGHADERGSREYNMALGERRANAVRDFLVLQGVSASLIEAVSLGEEKPVESGSYESSWSRNRRAEIK